jgi:hypothetical protein
MVVIIQHLTAAAAGNGPQWAYEREDVDMTLLSWTSGQEVAPHVNIPSRQQRKQRKTVRFVKQFDNVVDYKPMVLVRFGSHEPYSCFTNDDPS